jgi:hypothetical protein
MSKFLQRFFRRWFRQKFIVVFKPYRSRKVTLEEALALTLPAPGEDQSAAEKERIEQQHPPG